MGLPDEGDVDLVLGEQHPDKLLLRTAETVSVPLYHPHCSIEQIVLSKL